MSEEDIDRIRRWHEAAYQGILAEAGTDGRTYEYLGLTLFVPPQVQPIAGVAHLFGEPVLAEVRPDDRVLDMGTGSGVNAILAARTALDVVAVDVNPYALEAARDNARRNGVADRVDVRYSDVFSGVEGAFDLILFDPPFRWFTPRDELERGMADPGYRALTEFFATARARLTGRGRMLIFFGTSGDLSYLDRQIDENGFTREIVATDGLERDGVRVEYVTYRVR
jgi:release factor glutamine methyltransferase